MVTVPPGPSTSVPLDAARTHKSGLSGLPGPIQSERYSPEQIVAKLREHEKPQGQEIRTSPPTSTLREIQ